MSTKTLFTWVAAAAASVMLAGAVPALAARTTHKHPTSLTAKHKTHAAVTHGKKAKTLAVKHAAKHVIRTHHKVASAAAHKHKALDKSAKVRHSM